MEKDIFVIFVTFLLLLGVIIFEMKAPFTDADLPINSVELQREFYER